MDMTPEKALFIYKSSTTTGRSAYQAPSAKQGEEPKYYIECCDILIGGDGVASYGARRPLSVKALKSIADACGSQARAARPSGIMPERLLAAGRDGEMLWWLPAHTRRLNMHTKTNMPSGKAGLPPLLFRYNAHGLSCFALRENVRPSEDTEIFVAPLWNTDQNGTVCLGTAKISFGGSSSWENRMLAVESAYLDSVFSHWSGAPDQIFAKGPEYRSLDDLWRSVLETEGDFPVEALKSSSVTLVNLLRTI